MDPSRDVWLEEFSTEKVKTSHNVDDLDGKQGI